MRYSERLGYGAGRMLITGEWRQGPDYHTRRDCGTDDWLLIYTRSGAGQITTPRGAITTSAGDAILYAPGDFHDYGTAPMARHWHLSWAHFHPKPAWLAWLRWPKNGQGLRHLPFTQKEPRAKFAAGIDRMVSISRRTMPHAEDLAALALEEAIVWASVEIANQPECGLDERVRRALDYLTVHLQEPFRLELLARHCGLSVSRLAHLFATQTGDSPQRFQERQRMYRAEQILMMTQLTIAQVAAQVGYEDAFYFSKRFRKQTGVSPSEFRLGLGASRAGSKPIKRSSPRKNGRKAASEESNDRATGNFSRSESLWRTSARR